MGCQELGPLRTAVALKGSQPFVPAWRSSSSLTQEHVSLFSAIAPELYPLSHFHSGLSFWYASSRLSPRGGAILSFRRFYA